MPLLIIAGVGLALSLFSTGFSIYQYNKNVDRMNEQKADAKTQLEKQKRQALALQTQQFNRELQAMNIGVLADKKKILEDKRQLASMGTPVAQVPIMYSGGANTTTRR